MTAQFPFARAGPHMGHIEEQMLILHVEAQATEKTFAEVVCTPVEAGNG